MSRAFLSHSSKDKYFVKPIAELLGRDRCFYDEKSFEEGMQPIQEIFDCLNDTDIFVYFISENSLNSNWVKFELNLAKNKLNSQQKLEQIIPIIIDENIKYSDPRIANFLKEGMDLYNLRHINNYKIAYRKIINQFIKHRINQDHEFKERLNIFYGRDLEIKRFKDKYDDCSKTPMKCLVASGIEGIGRKAYIKTALKDTKIVQSYYSPITISLNMNETIDDLILKIADLGFGNYKISDINCLSSINSKIDILVDLFKEVQKYHEIIFIEDNLSLIGLDGTIKYWFEKALKKINNEIAVAIISNVKLDFMRYKKNDDVFFIELAELQKYERLGLLRTYAQLEDIQFDREDIDFLQGSLTGYPPQIQYCVDLAKKYSVEYVKKNSNLIVQRSSRKASEILQVIIDEKYKKQSYGFLSFLSNYDTVPIKILHDIFDLNTIYKDIFYKFIALTVCRFVGASNEYVKVNNIIQDYIQRNKYDLPKDIKDYLQNSIDEFNRSLNDPNYTDFLDLSELNYYIKENLKQGLFVPEKFLYSTIFLRTVIELYNDKKLEKVISIVTGLKENGYFEMYDDAIKKQIQSYYCLSLARRGAKEFVIEVDFFDKDDTYYNFLCGFNERLSGNFAAAESYQKKVIKKNMAHKRAKRELVLIYTSQDEYDLALAYAEENYNCNPENIYQIQAYFECIVRKDKISTKQRNEIVNMLATIKTLQKEKPSDVYYGMNAQYNLYVRKDTALAITFLREGLKKFKTSIFLTKDLFDTYEKCRDVSGMESALKLIEKIVNEDQLSYRPVLLRRQFILDAYKGKTKAVIEIELGRRIDLNKKMKAGILKKVESICN